MHTPEFLVCEVWSVHSILLFSDIGSSKKEAPLDGGAGCWCIGRLLDVVSGLEDLDSFVGHRLSWFI